VPWLKNHALWLFVGVALGALLAQATALIAPEALGLTVAPREAPVSVSELLGWSLALGVPLGLLWRLVFDRLAAPEPARAWSLAWPLSGALVCAHPIGLWFAWHDPLREAMELASVLDSERIAPVTYAHGLLCGVLAGQLLGLALAVFVRASRAWWAARRRPRG
jgi:hypothetical protein